MILSAADLTEGALSGGLGFPDVTQSPFLSSEWIVLARDAVARHAETAAPIDRRGGATVNLVVTDVPDDTEPVRAFIDTSKGRVEIDLGVHPDASHTLTTSFAVAKDLIISGDQRAAMNAWTNKQLKVSGNLFSLMGVVNRLNAALPDTLRDDIRAITSA